MSCAITGVGGAAGGAPPMKTAKSDVAGASGAPGKVAGDSGPGKDATQVGGAADAAKGAEKVSGDGGTDLKSALDALSAAIRSLAEAVSKMQVSGGGAGGCSMPGCSMPTQGAKVAGVRGGAATGQQFVARPARVERADNSGEDHAFEAKVLELVNKERAKAGLSPVRYNGTLDNAAEKHARHMGLVGRMAHDGIGDGDPGERIRAEGFRRGWGENVATGQSSPEQVVREWMNSPSHRRNILDPNFRSLGVAYTTAANGRSYWAQAFGS